MKEVNVWNKLSWANSRRHIFHMYRGFCGFIITAILALLACCPASAKQPSRPHQERVAQAQESLAPTSAQPTAYQYPYSCEIPKNAEQDNLCIARKSAQAAVDSAFWTRATVWVGVAGTIAVLLTLVVSVVSTFIALHSAKVAKDTLVATQRAYVFPDGVVGMWEIEPKTKRYNWRFRPYWKNSGETATVNMLMHTACKVLYGPLPNGFDFDYKAEHIGSGVLYPGMRSLGGAAPHPNDGVVTTQDLLDAQSGKKQIFVFGWLEYNDVFDKTPRHRTRFCWQIFPVGDPVKKPKDMRFDWISHTEGNSTDDM